MAYSSQITSTRSEMFQKLDEIKSRVRSDKSVIIAQQEALRRATLLKHRKVSTQLKLDMVHRQLTDLRRSVHESDPDNKFYRHQMAELSNELQDLGITLERAERNAFYARRRMLRNGRIDGLICSTSDFPLSSSHPAIYSSNECLDQRSMPSTRHSLKSRTVRLTSSPPKLRRKLLFGELRAVASLSSLNTKPQSHTNYDDITAPKESKSWKGPLKFLGNLVDNQIRRRFWNPAKRTKSAETVLEDNKPSNLMNMKKSCNGFRSSRPDVAMTYYSSSSSESSEDEEQNVDDYGNKDEQEVKSQVELTNGQILNEQRVQIDPNVLAEIEDFEKMAAQYISQHSQRTKS